VRSVGVPVSYGLDMFKNRQQERAQLLSLLAEPTTRLVTIVGRRGIGKSALAAMVLHDIERGRESRVKVAGIVNASTRTSGISLERLYLDCARLAGGDEERHLLAVWTGQERIAGKIEALLSTLRGGTYVVLLDNLEDKLSDDGHMEDEDLWAFVDAVFRQPGTVRFLVTTQVPIALPPELLRFDVRLQLDAGLPEQDAADLLRELDPNGVGGLREADEGALRHASQQVHGVPRALELVAGAMIGDLLTLPTLEGLLHTFPQRGDVVANLLQDRHRRLNPDARLMLQILSVFGIPVSRAAVGWAVQPFAPTMDSAPVLARLAQVQMVAVDRSARTFALHPMDADFAYGELDERRRQALELRVADWYSRQGSPEITWQSIDDVAPQRREFGHRLRSGDYQSAARVLDAIDEYLVGRGSVQAVLSMHAQIHDHLPDGPARCAHLAGYGFARLTTGPMNDAIDILEEARDGAARLGERGGEAKALLWLSYAYREVRRLAESVAAAEKSASIFGSSGRWQEEVRALFSAGLTSAYQGDATRALSVCDRMAALADSHNHPAAHARTMDIRAIGLLVADRYREAIIAADSAHAWYERAGITYEKGYDHNMAGLAYLQLREPDQAVRRFQAGLRDAEGAQSPRLAGICLHNLAWVHWRQGHYADASAEARQAVDAFHRAGNADTAPATALFNACKAMLAADHGAAATALLEAARGTIGNADIVPAADLAAESSRLARQAGLTHLADTADKLVIDFRPC
jgi:tetratricopeptide (TPR) repeat protein